MMTAKTSARLDALHTAMRQLATELAAVATCEANGYTSDLKFAQREVARLTALISRLQAKQ